MVTVHRQPSSNNRKFKQSEFHMPEKIRYEFARSEQSIFSEIYFPKRVAYYRAIFDALRHGYNETLVKVYLDNNIEALLNEFKRYPALFDPHDYNKIRRIRIPVSIAEAKNRIEMYKSPFEGWSTYSVDGVFFDRNGKMYEEATQVVRIMFRLKSSYAETASETNCGDVLRAILFWIIARQGRPYEHKMWSKGEEQQFIRSHTPWSKRKRLFVGQYFADIARETNKWIDDRALFIFAYLVRQFADQVLAEKLYEEETWISHFFDKNFIVISRIKLKPKKKVCYIKKSKSGWKKFSLVMEKTKKEPRNTRRST